MMINVDNYVVPSVRLSYGCKAKLQRISLEFFECVTRKYSRGACSLSRTYLVTYIARPR